jgi:hypothetical protein
MMAVLFGLVSIAIGGCSSASGHISVGARSLPGASSADQLASQNDPPVLPLSRAVARKLPGGVFYVLAGPNSGSFNLWEMTRSGDEIRLTRNALGYGISDFGASERGIVLADASDGLDRLAKLTARGPVFLPEGHASGPDINNEGSISFVRPGYDRAHPYFQLAVMRTESSRARVVYRQREDLLGPVWGPNAALAIISGGHAPGTTGPNPQLLVRSSAGHVRVIRTAFSRSLSNVIWTENAIGIAVTSWRGEGEVLLQHGRAIRLPAGWYPAAWSPTGKELLVFGRGAGLGPNGSLGLWSARHPRLVQLIGPMPASPIIGKIVWLARPAKTR